jgi:hypothetical protein
VVSCVVHTSVVYKQNTPIPRFGPSWVHLEPVTACQQGFTPKLIDPLHYSLRSLVDESQLGKQTRHPSIFYLGLEATLQRVGITIGDSPSTRDAARVVPIHSLLHRVELVQ